MQNGGTWTFTNSAPKPADKPRQQLQPVPETPDAQGMEAVARSLFKKHARRPHLLCWWLHFSAAGAACRTNAVSKPHAAAAAGKCDQGHKEGAASTFFHLSFSVKAMAPKVADADRTKRVEDSIAKYITTNCMEGILVRAHQGTTLRIEVAIRLLLPCRRLDVGCGGWTAACLLKPSAFGMKLKGGPSQCACPQRVARSFKLDRDCETLF
jgi:hypothetical protein